MGQRGLRLPRPCFCNRPDRIYGRFSPGQRGLRRLVRRMGWELVFLLGVREPSAPVFAVQQTSATMWIAELLVGVCLVAGSLLALWVEKRQTNEQTSDGSTGIPIPACHQGTVELYGTGCPLPKTSTSRYGLATPNGPTGQPLPVGCKFYSSRQWAASPPILLQANPSQWSGR